MSRTDVDVGARPGPGLTDVAAHASAQPATDWLAQIARRFRTVAAGPTDGDAQALRVGFIFGPRAMSRATRTAVRLRRGDGSIERQRFDDAGALAAHWIASLNVSFERAGLQPVARVGATGTLTEEESSPLPVAPGPLLVDLLQQQVHAATGAAPIECWAARHELSSVLLLLDWDLTLRKIERGAWGGVTPIVALPAGDGGEALFTPVSVVDIHAALLAHSWAHEFGHQLGLLHEGQPNRFDDRAQPWTCGDDRRARFSLMRSGHRRERGRRLEWSHRMPAEPRWGDAEHDEAAWLRLALPQLARQRFRCAGMCGGTCTLMDAARLNPTAAAGMAAPIG